MVGARLVLVAAARTVMRNAVSEELALPSETVNVMSALVPTSDAAGVPLN